MKDAALSLCLQSRSIGDGAMRNQPKAQIKSWRHLWFQTIPHSLSFLKTQVFILFPDTIFLNNSCELLSLSPPVSPALQRWLLQHRVFLLSCSSEPGEQAEDKRFLCFSSGLLTLLLPSLPSRNITSGLTPNLESFSPIK